MYYRLHDKAISGKFCPENAKSEPFDDAAVRCPECFGTGSVWVENPDWSGFDFDEPANIEEECPLCQSEGYVYWASLRDRRDEYDMGEYLQEGYSCFLSVEDMRAYIQEYGWYSIITDETPDQRSRRERKSEGLDGEPPIILPRVSLIDHLGKNKNYRDKITASSAVARPVQKRRKCIK